MSAFSDKINSETPTLVDFHAIWCGPCKTQEPILKSAHKKFGDKVSFLKVDIDKNPNASSFYQVKAVPTLILFKKGEIKWRHSGVVAEQELEQILKQHITHV
ncbi:MAG: thioredoxin [Saprospiraceae bacterium]